MVSCTTGKRSWPGELGMQNEMIKHVILPTFGLTGALAAVTVVFCLYLAAHQPPRLPNWTMFSFLG
jgi:hypothetical protein